MKTYKVICKDIGHRFSFNAKNIVEATDKLNSWLRYHSYNYGGFKIEETADEKWIHNEYIN